jgi:hypothetical protein
LFNRAFSVASSRLLLPSRYSYVTPFELARQAVAVAIIILKQLACAIHVGMQACTTKKPPLLVRFEIEVVGEAFLACKRFFSSMYACQCLSQMRRKNTHVCDEIRRLA